MQIEDLKTLSFFGNALWADSDYSERVAVETITAVSLLDLTPDRSMERVSSALLSRAIKDGVEVNASVINRPFFRLHPMERFILSALHLGRWSYERLGRVLKKTPEEIGKIAWSARLRLISTPGRPVYVPHPTGSDLNGVRCPDYDQYNPWTQRFLDDEMTNRERIFMQNHLMACDRCRQALSRCRNLYYTADALVPRPPKDQDRVRVFEKALARLNGLRRPTERSFLQSVKVFAERRDIQLLAGAILVFVVVNLIR
jgi:hypothetical protein